MTDANVKLIVIHLSICLSIYLYIYIYVYIYIYMCVFIYLSLSLYIYMYMYICMYYTSVWLPKDRHLCKTYDDIITVNNSTAKHTFKVNDATPN